MKNRLSAFVDKTTGREYQLMVSAIHLNLITGKLSLDSVRLTSRNNTEDHFTVAAGEMTISGMIANLLFPSGELTIRRLEINEPLIEIYKATINKKEGITKEELFDQFHTFFNQHTKKIVIGHIAIRNAAINHHSLAANLPPYAIRNLDLTMTNLYMDKMMITQRDELFRADQVNLTIRDFNRMLGDKLHHIHMDEFTYSIQDKKVHGKNIRLLPTDTTDRDKTLYWVTIPDIELESDKLSQFSVSDTITIKSLKLNQSKIRIRPPREKNGTTLREFGEFDLYQLFEDNFQLLTIGHLSIENTDMRIDSRTNNDRIFQEFGSIGIDINGFRLDSTAWMQPDRILYSDNFRLAIGSYLLKFNDLVHQFSAAKIFVSSPDSLIQAGHINLAPVNSGIKLPTTVNLNCDSVRLLSVDFARLFHSREMPLKEVTAFKPTVTINQYEKPAQKNRDNQSLLYHFIGNYIKGVYAQVVAIEGGHLAINDLQNLNDPGIIETDFNFRLTGFTIDSITARKSDKLFYADNLSLNFRHYNMKLDDKIHWLSIDQADISSFQKLITVKELHLFPDKRINIKEALARLKRTELYDIKVPALTLYPADINQAFFSKKLKISHFSIISPDIYLELFGNRKKQEKEFNLDEFYGLLNSYLTHIEIGQIEAPDGQLRLVNHNYKGKTIDLTNEFSLHLYNFVLNDNELKKNRLLFSDHFDLKLKDYLFKLSDNVHLLKAKEISLSSQNASVSVSDALLYPLVSSPDYKDLSWHLQIKIPLITLEQVDMEQFYFSQVLRMGSLSIESPVIEIYRNRSKTNKLNFKDPAIPLPEEMKEVTLGKMSLKNGKLKVYRNTSLRQQLVAESDIDFMIEQGSLKKAPNISTAKFSSGNIETSLTGLHLNPENIPYTVNVEQINFSSQKGLLLFSGLSIRSLQKDQHKVIAGIRVPTLRFEQLDPVDAFQNNRFHAGRIYSDKPVFILNAAEKKTTKNPLIIKLPPDIQPVMDELSAGKVTVDDATFIFQQNNKENRHDHIYIVLERFRLDSLQSGKPFGADNLLIYKNDNQFTDKNKHYDFQVDRISFSSQENTFSLSGIRILPRYSREAYQKVIPYQSDHYTGSIKEIELSGIDPDRWFEKHELKATNVLISHPRIDIYRDKRTPFNEKQIKRLPQELIRGIDLPFYFDSVNVAGADISYAEQAENLPGPGIVRFSDLSGSLFPLTNMKAVLNKNSHMTLTASGLMMNKPTLTVRMDFDMNSPTSRFKVKGSLSPFQLAALNPFTEFNAQIMVRSGELNRFDFDFEADSVSSIGKLWFAYDDLRISILEQKDGDTKEAKLLSFLANNLVLRSKNPRTKILQPDDIYFERDPKRSIINYWWKTIFSGAKNTFGIKE